MRFRNRPAVIEAREFEDTAECRDGLVRWIRQHGRVAWTEPPEPEVCIETLEGTMRASPGDWIIRGVAGEFYPCKPEIFAATYEPVEGAAPREEPCPRCQGDGFTVGFADRFGEPWCFACGGTGKRKGGA